MPSLISEEDKLLRSAELFDAQRNIEVYGIEWKVYYDVNYIIKRINRETQTSEPCERSKARERVNF